MTCPTGKIAFTSAAEAHRSNRCLQRRGYHLEVYRCTTCGAWHHGRSRAHGRSLTARAERAKKRGAQA